MNENGYILTSHIDIIQGFIQSKIEKETVQTIPLYVFVRPLAKAADSLQMQVDEITNKSLV